MSKISNFKGDRQMNLFQSVLNKLGQSKGPVTFEGIACAIGKSKMSVRGEIGRLKKTSWFGRWLRVDWKKEEVTLAQALRGCRMETLEFLVKQFYNEDKRLKKGIFDKSKRIDLNDPDAIQDELSRTYIKTTGIKEVPKLDFSDIELEEKKEPEGAIISFEDLNFDDLGCSVNGGGK